MRATIFTHLGYYTYQGPWSRSQYDGQRTYCDPSTSSEVFLIFTTQLYSYLCSYNAIDFIS